jgi:hypothetical protein
VSAAAAVLAKASGLLGIGGLVLAVLVIRGRASPRILAWVAGGVALALAYDLWRAG